MPDAILICGANGAGKTTFGRQLLPLLYPEAVFLNVDEIQRETPGLSDPVAAARELLRRLEHAEKARSSLALETTLASRSYARRIRWWQSLGYQVAMHFIEVPSADFAVRRVRGRVADGGHAVPEADIRRRFERGLRLFSEVYQPLVHEWYRWYSNDEGLRLADRYDEA